MERRSHLPLPPVIVWALVALALTVTAGAWIQWYWRSQQYVDIGSPLDQGYVDYFSTREASDTDADLTFRWSQPWSRLHLWPVPPGRPAILRLHMLAPPRPDVPQSTRLTVDERPLAEIALSLDLRSYALLLPPQRQGNLIIVLESAPLVLNDPDDARQLGVALESVQIAIAGRPAAGDLLRECWTAPLLPVGLLLLGCWALLLRLRPLLAGGLPVLALAALLLLVHLLPAAALPLAAFLSGGALVLGAVAAAQRLFEHLPGLAPTTDDAARAWICLVFVLALLTTFNPIINSDGVGYYAYLRSFTMDGDLQFANEYAAPAFSRAPWSMPLTRTNHMSNPWSVGPAIFWAPFYGVAHLLVLVGQMLGIAWEADGYASPYIVLSLFASALAGLVTMLGSYHIGRRFVDPPVATLAVVSIFAGSNLMYYTMLEGSFAHALSAAAATLYLLAWLRLEEAPGISRWAVVGAAAGAMLLVYWIAALLLLLPALTFLRLLARALQRPPHERRQQLARLLPAASMAAVLCLLIFSPQMLAWNVLYGSFITVPQGSGFASPGGADWGAFLFSPLHGLLPWTPAFFVAVPAVGLLWPRSRWYTLCCMLCIVLYLWYNAALPNWHGSGAFGLRRITLLAPWLVIGLALLYERLRQWHPFIPGTVAALLSTWTMLLLVRYYMFLLPHDIRQLYRMPPSAFFLSSDALPFDRLPVLLYDGYFWRTLIAQPPTLAGLLEAATLIALLLLALWGIFWLVRQERTRAALAPPSHATAGGTDHAPVPRG